MRDTWYIDFLPMRAPIEASFEKAGGGDFVLPVASSEILGGVRPVNKTEEMIQPVGVDSEGRLWTEEGGNRQIQANWAQNDPSAPDYISNRTHWEEEGLIDVIPSQTVILPENSGRFVLLCESGPVLIPGQTYTVVLNDVTYECVARKFDVYVCLGNGAIIGHDDDMSKGEPFYIQSYGGFADFYLYVPNYGNYTISILEYDTIVHKLESKYLPDEINETFDELFEGVTNNNIIAHEAIDKAAVAQSAADNAQSAANNKLDAINPDGTGSFSINRSLEGEKGACSIALGESVIANADNSLALGKYNIQMPLEIIEEWVVEERGYYGGEKPTVIINLANNYYFDELAKEYQLEGNIQPPLSINSGEATLFTGTKYGIIETERERGLFRVENQFVIKVNRKTGLYYITNASWMHRTIKAEYMAALGNGTSDSARSNAHTLDWSGNAWYSGDVYVGSTSGINKDSGSKKLATEEFVESKIQTTLHLKRKVVDALPDLSIAEPEVIYMVPRPMQLVDNVYDEYMLIDGAWELIGSTSVDLTDYATKEEVEQKAQVQILIWEDDD